MYFYCYHYPVLEYTSETVVFMHEEFFTEEEFRNLLQKIEKETMDTVVLTEEHTDFHDIQYAIHEHFDAILAKYDFTVAKPLHGHYLDSEDFASGLTHNHKPFIDEQKRKDEELKKRRKEWEKELGYEHAPF